MYLFDVRIGVVRSFRDRGPVAGDRAYMVPGRHPLPSAVLLHHVRVVVKVAIVESKNGDIVDSFAG